MPKRNLSELGFVETPPPKRVDKFDENELILELYKTYNVIDKDLQNYTSPNGQRKYDNILTSIPKKRKDLEEEYKHKLEELNTQETELKSLENHVVKVARLMRELKKISTWKFDNTRTNQEKLYWETIGCTR